MFIYVILPALIPLVYVLWAGAPDTFDHDDICKCPTLVSPLRTFRRYAYPPFPPQHPNVQPRIIFSLAFRSMATSTRARKRLLRDSDLDASIRLLDAVRDTPTASTPPVALVVAIFQAWAQSDEGVAAREKQVLGMDGKPSALVTSSEYTALLEEIAALKALVRGNPPAVGFDRDSMKAKPLCHRCRKAGKGEVYHPYRDCPLGGRQHSPATAAAFCIPIEQEDAEGLHALALVQVFQDAADIGPEAFSHAALAYGPPAVLSTDGVGGIDVAAYGFSAPPPPSGGTDDEDILRRLDALTSEVQAAQEKVHFTHASFIPGSGAEGHASALVCGPAAAVGITPEGQVPAGGAAASASAVPAPAMPVSQVEDVEPAPTQSARVTTTEATCGEFGGFVQTVNHAAVHPTDLTGYDTDDYEDFADGTFAVKPRAPASAIGCSCFGFHSFCCVGMCTGYGDAFAWW
ncbi:hypothetical protein CYMTET_11075 [Cymbomonas tetramitiformis]|uniref:Uncharacterized protein n=1 Tax=Cymbomonas tetramitiformis TaxID=36881 RepID=A0AAE0LDC7_9CHLO|nr:hypothetical protein CYMTET_11075 [Cymbomonas tetramitiformis]